MFDCLTDRHFGQSNLIPKKNGSTQNTKRRGKPESLRKISICKLQIPREVTKSDCDSATFDTTHKPVFFK